MLPYSSVRTVVQRTPKGKWAHGILLEDKGVMKLGYAMAAQRSRHPKSHTIGRGMDRWQQANCKKREVCKGQMVSVGWNPMGGSSYTLCFYVDNRK